MDANENEMKMCDGLPTRSSSGNSSDPNRTLSSPDGDVLATIKKFNLNSNKQHDNNNDFNHSKHSVQINKNNFSSNFKNNNTTTSEDTAVTSKHFNNSYASRSNNVDQDFQPYFKQATSINTQ